jgi:hypothetical protein
MHQVYTAKMKQNEETNGNYPFANGLSAGLAPRLYPLCKIKFYPQNA